MYNNDDNIQDEGRRNMKKVRLAFLNKEADQSEPKSTENFPRTLDHNKSYMIASTLGLGVLNKKIHIDTQFLNIHYSISSISIQVPLPNKLVVMNLALKQKDEPKYWEQAVQILEEDKNEDFLKWAKKIRDYYTNYPNLINGYFDLIRSNNPKVIANLRKAKARAVLALREIEQNHIYQRAVFFSNKESTQLLSTSYSDVFLHEIDYTVDNFISLVKEKGLPPIFESDNTKLLGLAESYLDFTTLNGNPVQETPEYTTYLYTKDGEKRYFIGQYVNIVEPTPEGVFTSAYFIIKRRGVLGVINDDASKTCIIGPDLETVSFRTLIAGNKSL